MIAAIWTGQKCTNHVLQVSCYWLGYVSNLTSIMKSMAHALDRLLTMLDSFPQWSHKDLMSVSNTSISISLKCGA